MDDKIVDIKTLVTEFITRYENVNDEIDGLRADRSALLKEYKDKLDVKALRAALQICKIRQNIGDRDALDNFEHILDKA